MRIFKRGSNWAFQAFSVTMVFLPESMFSHFHWISKDFFENNKFLCWIDAYGCNIVLTRIGFFFINFLFLILISAVYSLFRRKVKIQGENYSIVIEYGDLLKKKNCQRVINFDECFTTTIGIGAADIKKDTVCGQYLQLNPNLDVEHLVISSAKPCRRKSKYNNKTCYEPGTLVPNGDDLLMAFTRLESNGKSLKFTVEEYLKCLELLWEEIDNNYCQKDVCIPLLGSGVARFENGNTQSIPKEELIGLIVSSYKLSQHKLKDSNSLHIVCKKSKDFSLDMVGD